MVAFYTRRAEASAEWPALAAAVGPLGTIWVAWPKKASKVPTDITEDVWRDILLPTGWVDVRAGVETGSGSSAWGGHYAWKRAATLASASS